MDEVDKSDVDYVAQGFRDGIKDIPPQHELNYNYMKGYERALDRRVNQQLKDVTELFK